MKPKLKAHRMWAMPHDLARESRDNLHLGTCQIDPAAIPVAVLPLNNVNALVEQVTAAIVALPFTTVADAERSANAALQSLGILPAKRKLAKRRK